MANIKAGTRARAAAVLFIVWSVTMAIGAAAAAEIITIPVDTVVRGPEGSVHVLAGAAVPADRVGNRCSVHAISQNQESVHPNSDLIVASGGSSVTLFDVEREGGGRTDGTGMLTLGETVAIEIRLGADEVFSGGFIVGLCETEITCRNPALAIGVTPEDQEVAIGGHASFDVTVTNSGDEAFSTVTVESNVAACDSNIGALPVGQQSSYSCTAEDIDTTFDLDVLADGRGEDPSCVASAAAGAHVTVSSEQSCTTNPELIVTVVPEDQDVPVDGDASFQVTVTNSGDDDLQNVTVDSSLGSCDKDIGALAVGEESSYSCTAGGVDTDINVSFVADGQGVSDPDFCVASGNAASTVGNPPPPTTTPPTTTPATTAAPRIPSGVPTGTAEANAPLLPFAALAVLAVGALGVAAGSYQVTRKRR